MISLRSECGYEIHGREDLDCFMIDGMPGLNPRTLAGQTVSIDGRDRVVVGVETYALLDKGVTGTKFGLCVQRDAL